MFYEMRRWSLGYKGSQLHFVNNSTLVFGCGNALTFIHSDGTHIRSLPSEGRGVGTIAVCPKIGLIAYTESTLNPQIFMLKYPDGSLINTLKGMWDPDTILLTPLALYKNSLT